MTLFLYIKNVKKQQTLCYVSTNPRLLHFPRQVTTTHRSINCQAFGHTYQASGKMFGQIGCRSCKIVKKHANKYGNCSYSNQINAWIVHLSKHFSCSILPMDFMCINTYESLVLFGSHLLVQATVESPSKQNQEQEVDTLETKCIWTRTLPSLHWSLDWPALIYPQYWSSAMCIA